LKPLLSPFLLLSLILSVAAFAQSAAPRPIDAASPTPQVEVLILGSYHMDNPAHDLHNIAADDVLTAKRQDEIAELARVLERFHPTKIAIEWSAGSQTSLDRLYADYLAGKHELNRDERQQIGFRLAKQLGLKKLCAIDALWDFPYGSVINWAKAHGRAAELEAIDRIGDVQSRADADYLLHHSILDVYRRLNSPAWIAANAAIYARIGHFGDDDDPAGARLLTRWHERNTLILTSLLNASEPGDRVLVIYGAGHLAHLRRFVADDPTLRLRSLEEFTASQK